VKALERRLQLPSVVAISVIAMIGSGLFVLPGLASAMAGADVWAAYLIAAVCALPAVFSKAELATAMPTSGGTYVYLERSLGPLAGTITGLGLWLSMLLKAAFALVGFGAYLSILADVPLKPMALGLLAIIVTLNVVGIRHVAKAQIAVTSVALLFLWTLVAVSLFSFTPDRLEAPFDVPPFGLLSATGFIFVSYAGVTKVAAIAEEVKNPDRNLPLGMALSLLIATSTYVLVTLVLVGNVPLAELATDLRPVYTLAAVVGGPTFGTAAAVLSVATMTSMANSGLLAASRFPFAMSRDNLVPSALRSVNERFTTPVVSILATGATIAFCIVFLDVERMAKIASSFVVLLYIAVNIAVVVFREAGVQWYAPAFRSPLYPWTQVLGILSGIVLLAVLGPVTLLAIGVTALGGIALYLLYGRHRSAHLGVLKKIGKRPELLAEAKSIEDTITGAAAVVVPLFGEERSPEALVEVGVALAAGKRVEVVHLTEVPEQTLLEAVLEDDAPVKSLARRIGAIALEKKVDIDFHAVVSRDLVQTTHRITNRVDCDWLVMQWRGRIGETLLPYNPLGWLINHLSTNLALFQDAGIRYIRAILVVPQPGPDDALVVRTADHLASVWGAGLTFARFVADSAPETAVLSARQYLEQLAELCSTKTEIEIVRGKRGTLAIAAATTSFDLLITGAPDLTLRSILRGESFDVLSARAACSVLTLKTPRQRTHEAFDRQRARVERRFSILEYVDDRCARPHLVAARKDALFDRFAEVFSEVLSDADEHDIDGGLWDRERTQNTAVGNGVAMPHATLDIPHMVLGIFTTREPMDYEAPDGVAVDVFFVTLGPEGERQTHLHILSSLAALSMKTGLLDRLRSAQSAEEMLEATRQCCADLDKMSD